MARLPGWLVCDSYSRDSQGLVANVRIRPWHPSFLPELWRLFNHRPLLIRSVVVLRAWFRVMRALR